jgi:hypothetical protein
VFIVWHSAPPESIRGAAFAPETQAAVRLIYAAFAKNVSHNVKGESNEGASRVVRSNNGD